MLKSFVLFSLFIFNIISKSGKIFSIPPIRFILLSNRADMPQIYKAMDVFLFPSRYEGLGIVLIEAQITGIHCVVSDRIP